MVRCRKRLCWAWVHVWKFWPWEETSWRRFRTWARSAASRWSTCGTTLWSVTVTCCPCEGQCIYQRTGSSENNFFFKFSGLAVRRLIQLLKPIHFQSGWGLEKAVRCCMSGNFIQWVVKKKKMTKTKQKKILTNLVWQEFGQSSTDVTGRSSRTLIPNVTLVQQLQLQLYCFLIMSESLCFVRTGGGREWSWTF